MLDVGEKSYLLPRATDPTNKISSDGEIFKAY